MLIHLFCLLIFQPLDPASAFPLASFSRAASGADAKPTSQDTALNLPIKQQIDALKAQKHGDKVVVHPFADRNPRRMPAGPCRP
jgi:hypothetical protein